MEKKDIIESIAARGNGEIYLGVVGAVRTGKSTFIKRVIENLVVPHIEDEYEKKRCLDEIPQSAQGKAIMTTEPKFVPSNGAKIKIDEFSADDGGLPKAFSKTNEKGVPYMASILNGVVATIIIIIGVVLGEVSETASNLFWTFFSLSLVTLLISYIPLFLAFKKLREKDKTPRVYKISGGNFVINLITYVPFVLLILGIIFTMFGDFTMEYINGNLPLIIGVILSFIAQEVIVSRIKEEN